MQVPTEIRVFIADEQQNVLDQLSEFINGASDMHVVGTAADGGQLLEHFQSGKNGVDVALVDIGMPVMDGLTAVKKIKKICGDEVKLLVITGLRGRDYPTEAVSRDADGFVAKNRSKEEILGAIRDVHSSTAFVYLPDLSDPAHPQQAPKSLPELIPIEQRILCMLVKGMISKEIADETGLSVYNVDRIRRIVMHKLEAETPTMLGVIAEKYGLCRD